MLTRRPRLLPGALTLVALLAPAAARAQFVTVEARAGAVRAVGEYADALGSGQTIGVGISSRFTPTLSLRLDADANTGFENGPASPDLYSYMVGLETQLVPSRLSRVRPTPVQITAVLSGGVSQLRYGAYTDPGAPLVRYGAETRLEPAVGAGLRVTASLTRTLALFGGASATATLLGGAQSAPDVVGARRSPLADGGTLVTVPVVAGVRIGF